MNAAILSEPVDLTLLIRRAQRGDAAAADQLFQCTYEELRGLAHARLRAAHRNTLLDTTALVHEWFVRFAKARGLDLEDRRHFLRYAAHAMRTIIVDFARRRSAGRRGGGVDREPLDPELEAAGEASEEIVRVHEALEELAGLDARMAEVVELRYFGGLSEVEIAAALGVTDRTVRRDWEKARLWLLRALHQP